MQLSAKMFQSLLQLSAQILNLFAKICQIFHCLMHKSAQVLQWSTATVVTICAQGVLKVWKTVVIFVQLSAKNFSLCCKYQLKSFTVWCTNLLKYYNDLHWRCQSDWTVVDSGREQSSSLFREPGIVKIAVQFSWTNIWDAAQPGQNFNPIWTKKH